MLYPSVSSHEHMCCFPSAQVVARLGFGRVNLVIMSIPNLAWWSKTSRCKIMSKTSRCKRHTPSASPPAYKEAIVKTFAANGLCLYWFLRMFNTFILSDPHGEFFAQLLNFRSFLLKKKYFSLFSWSVIRKRRYRKLEGWSHRRGLSWFTALYSKHMAYWLSEFS